MSLKNKSKDVNKFIHNYKDFVQDSAILNSLIMKSKQLDKIENLPVTLFPSPFPEDLFHNVVRIQKDFNVLYNKLSRDHEALFEILKNIIEKDDFIKRIWNIYETIRNQPNSQTVFLSLIRNDFMISLPDEYRKSEDELSELVMKPGVTIKQIEYNLMASSFAGIAQKVLDFHKTNLKLIGVKSAEIESKIPPNHPADGLAKGLICAWQVYKTTKAAILFLVGERERNVYDHRILEQCIYEQNPSVLIIRKSFNQCLKEGKLDENNCLWINDYEIAVVYFRSGYAPEHFYNDQIWESKLMLEKSKAIKCPSIQQMLVNTKLVQQALSNYTLLKKYLPDVVVQELVETFANQYLLNDLDKIETAIQFPEKFVLKPQREGGGNNYFDDDLVRKLTEIRNTEEKHQYVLMERLYPASCKNYILSSSGEISKQSIVSELGIFGVFLGNESETFANYQCGYLLRSKPVNVNEGGVSAGFGCIDSIYLV
uniref:Glutathione synthetase n=1 Tax=Dugesia japonica TaxID=6161 RepID=M9NTD0_DUGJA|nr:glutathione synthetase [Dugesia japonica]